MASRYGRKKRQQHRELIADLERLAENQAQAIRMDRALLSRQRDELGRLRERMKDWDERVRAMLGPYTSAAVDDVTFRVDHPDEVAQMPIMPRIDPVMFLRSDTVAEEQVAYYVESILHLIGSMREADRFRMSRDICFEIQARGQYRVGEARLGMSESYFQDLQRAGDDGVAIMARRIAPRIARLLLEGAKKARGVA